MASNTDSTFELDLLPAQTVLAAHRNSRSANLVQTWNRYKLKTGLMGLLFLFPLTFISAESVEQTGPLVIPEVSLALQKKSILKESDRVQSTAITQKTINASATADLSNLLQQEQSIVRVVNNTNDNSHLVLSIRGFGDNAFANSLIVVDGFPLTNPSVLAPSFNAIPLDKIAHINMIQGSEGSLWGNQAVGGVVEITTRHPEKALLDASLDYGSYNTQRYNFFAGDRFSNGSFVNLTGFSNTTDNYRAHNHQKNQGLASTFGVDYATGSLVLNANFYDDQIELPGGLTQAQYNANPQQASNFTNFSHYQTQVYELAQRQALNQDWLLETRFSHNEIEGNGVIGSAYTREDRLDRISPVLSGTLFGSKVLFGYEGEASHFQLVNAVTSQAANIDQNDLYSQAIIPIVNTLDMTLGGRFAAQNGDFHNHLWVSEQGLAYHPTSEWDFFVRRDGNFRLPKANEQTTLPVGASPLVPQTGVSYELGGKWHTSEQTLQLSLYRLTLNHEIAYDPTATEAAPFGSYTNFSETRRDGVTVSEAMRLTTRWMLEGQLNYVRARFVAGSNTGNQIPAVPAFNGNAGFNYVFQQDWTMEYRGVYTGSAYPSQDVGNVQPRLSAYWLHNIALRYARQDFDISFEVQNILNQRYSTYTVYSPASNSNTYYPGAGRNFLLKLKVNVE